MDIVAHIEKNMTDADWAELEEQRAAEDAEMERDLLEHDQESHVEEARAQALVEIEKNKGNPQAQLMAGLGFALTIINGGRRA